MSFHGGRPKMLPKPAGKSQEGSEGRQRATRVGPETPPGFFRGFLCSMQAHGPVGRTCPVKFRRGISPNPRSGQISIPH